MLTAGLLVTDTTLVVTNAPVAFCLSVVIIGFVIVSFICLLFRQKKPFGFPRRDVPAPHEIFQPLRPQIVARLLDSIWCAELSMWELAGLSDTLDAAVL
jgi:hypothetical protein